jgi:hypothetical protein
MAIPKTPSAMGLASRLACGRLDVRRIDGRQREPSCVEREQPRASSVQAFRTRHRSCAIDERDIRPRLHDKPLDRHPRTLTDVVVMNMLRPMGCRKSCGQTARVSIRRCASSLQST